ncbi:MAG TPA: hypothetical protein ENN07_02285 [candidate division Zixibacteria bacterium]|nr:hypothetical protein [candidate division Zixibacteria bacterium]
MNKYAWTNRPASEFKGRKIFGIVVIALTAVAVFLGSDDNWVLALISVLLMFFASSKFYFKTHYYADEVGIGEKFLGYYRLRKWREFRRVDVGERAVFLSPFEEPRRMDNFRGWLVPVPSDEVKEFIVEKVRDEGEKA